MPKKYLLLCYPTCSTCKKAQQWLDEKGISYELRDIKAENPTAAELRKWQEQSSIPIRKLFNTSGLVYKSLQLKEKLPGMGEEDMFSLLATDGMLVKRPILVAGDRVFVGYKEAEWNTLHE